MTTPGACVYTRLFGHAGKYQWGLQFVSACFAAPRPSGHWEQDTGECSQR